LGDLTIVATPKSTISECRVSQIRKSVSGAVMALLSLAIVVPLFFEQWELSLFILILFGLCLYIVTENKRP
jgi:hypothetical protein